MFLRRETLGGWQVINLSGGSSKSGDFAQQDVVNFSEYLVYLKLSGVYFKKRMMTFYQNEINRIKKVCYSNKGQIAMVIGTRSYISNNFEKELNLEFLSQIRFTSKFHFLRLFKKYYGQTPKQYITAKRLEKSKEFLINGRSVSETCYSVGFESPSSFITLFKKKTGLTPGKFQKEQFSQS